MRERQPGPRRQIARKLGWGRAGGKPGKEVPREGAKRLVEGCKERKGPHRLGKPRQCQEGGPAAG